MHKVSPSNFPFSSRFSHSSVTPSLRRHTQRKKKHACKQAQIHNTTSPCLSPSSDSINAALGEDDSCVRLMSRRPKVTSPSTSLGSTLTWLPSAPTKPHDCWYRVFTMHPRIPMTPVTPCLHMSQFKMSWVGVGPVCEPSGAPNHALGDTVVWRGDREEVEMSWVWVFLIDEWTWMRTGQSWPFEDSSSQNKFINGPTSETQPIINILTGWAIELYPRWHLIFPSADKRPQLELLSVSLAITTQFILPVSYITTLVHLIQVF